MPAAKPMAGRGWRGRHHLPPLILFLAALMGNTTIYAEVVYQASEVFMRQAFAGAPPAPGVLWVTDERRAVIHEILGHDLPVLRLRYWQKNGRSAWVLDEIGKERPITVGIVVADGAIERVRVLVFRESRGDEVRHAFFTDQFNGARLGQKRVLDRHIDGISGATLSVRALVKVARLALYLDGALRNQGG